MDIRARILQLLKSLDYQPLRRSELARELSIEDDERPEFRRVLREMMQRGEIVRVRKNRFVLPQETLSLGVQASAWLRTAAIGRAEV